MEKEIEFIKEKIKEKCPRKKMVDLFYQEFGVELHFDDAWEQAHAKPVPEVDTVEEVRKMREESSKNCDNCFYQKGVSVCSACIRSDWTDDYWRSKET